MPVFPYHREKYPNVGQAHCPDCGSDQFFGLVEETLSVSTTYHLVCNECGYKSKIRRREALKYMPRQSLLESHPLVIGWLGFAVLAIVSAIIWLMRQ